MNFIYAVNNQSVLSAAVLESTELDKVLDEPGKVPTVTSTIGPGGAACLLLGKVPASKLRYVPDDQVWMESYNGKYYIGHYLSEPPTEKELARNRQLSGHRVEIEGCGQWLIPIARKFAEGCALPVSLALGAKGEIITESLPEYVGFSMRAEKFYFDTLREWGDLDGDVQMDVEARLKLAMEAITFNYQIGIEEIRMLELIRSTNLRAILEAIIDIPTIIAVNEQMAEAKKKDETADTPG